MELKVASPGRIWSTDPRVPVGPLLKHAAVEDALAQMAAKTRTGKVMKALQEIDNELENTNDSMNPGSNPDRSALVNRYRDNETLDRNIQKEAELTEELLKEAQWALLGRLFGGLGRAGGLLERARPAMAKALAGRGARMVESGGLRDWLARRGSGLLSSPRVNAFGRPYANVSAAEAAGGLAHESRLAQEVAASRAAAVGRASPGQILSGGTMENAAGRSLSDRLPAYEPSMTPGPGQVLEGGTMENVPGPRAPSTESLPAPPGMAAPAPEGAAVAEGAGEAASGPPPKPGFVEAYRDVFRPGGFGRVIKAPGNRFGLGVGALMTLPSLVHGDISLPQAAFNVLAPLPAFRAGGGIGMATSLLTPTVSEHIFGGAPAAPPPMPMQAPSPPINVSVAAPAAPAMPQAPVFQPGYGAYGR